MASRTKKDTAVEVAPEPTVYGPEMGGNVILAAWQGLYHLFGARAERMNVTTDGVFIVNPTVAAPYDFATIVADLTHGGNKVSNRRLDFFPAFFWALGETPAPFENAAHLTTWLTTFLKSKGINGKGRSPQYAKDAIQAYKNLAGIAVPRGRPRKATIKIADLGSLDESALEGIDISEITRLRETLDGVIANATAAVAA